MMAKPKQNRQDAIENVRVVIRVRPLSKSEQAEGYRNIVTIDRNENVINLSKPATINEKSKTFKFDHIFPEDSTQVSLCLVAIEIFCNSSLIDGSLSPYSFTNC